MALSNPIQHLNRTNIARIDYPGKVIDNKDPLKLQRVKIRVPQLHRNIPDDKLPWVMPMDSGRQTNAGVGVGGVNVPPIGAKLNFSLVDNDPHNPRAVGSPTTADVTKDNELLNEDYPGTYGDIDHAGNKRATNTEKNTISEVHVKGSTRHIDGDGSISEFSVKDLNLSAKGDINIVADGKINLHAKGATDIKGSTISLNGSSAGLSSAPPGARTRPNIPSPAGKETE